MGWLVPDAAGRLFLGAGDKPGLGETLGLAAGDDARGELEGAVPQLLNTTETVNGTK